jgi:hypothetical protein
MRRTGSCGCCGRKLSNVSSTVASYNEYSRALTFENFFKKKLGFCRDRVATMQKICCRPLPPSNIRRLGPQLTILYISPISMRPARLPGPRPPQHVSDLEHGHYVESRPERRAVHGAPAVYVCTYVCMHLCIHTRTHTHTHAHTHTETETETDTHIHTYIYV